ncbi:hypothetical protein [Neobacillus massiliamazoniensis]|jgi:hypothetical protein|uniref:Uncharacterized protein n=1 Tax=Neobacillus massiliamazoniensis TaxID=1499688 RepID=A0A0U1P466_9BACI|nr:hypothetical protein [Neobacillus massiliamazoniensis]CRK84872.1 hypothetical protein BN000_04927 [Neobacillus massiliamazoniensis]
MGNNEKDHNQTITFRFVKEGEQDINVGPLTDLTDKPKVVIVINNQFTIAPNTTQIASGAGRNSAAGNNAAIDASNTEQQQSVGAEGEANNTGMSGEQIEPHQKNKEHKEQDVEFVLVINNQVNKTSRKQAGATQVASGGGDDSAAGTNAAIESSNTKQQHSVGGGGTADNSGEDSDQTETSE